MGDARGGRGDRDGGDEDAAAVLARSWPPDDGPGSDYRRATLAGTDLVAATRLPGGGALALARAGLAGGWSLVPVVAVDGAPSRWRRAAAGDGVAAGLVRTMVEGAVLHEGFALAVEAAARSLLPGEGRERALGTDQTNETVIVDGRVGVKWLLHPDRDRERAPRLLRHLAGVGFREVPPLLGCLTWRAAAAEPPLTLAQVDAWLPDARDGWDWCTEAVLAHAAPAHACGRTCPARLGAPLGGLVARLHLALATPSEVIPAPVSRAGAPVIAEWLAVARRVLHDAVELTERDDATAGALLRAWRPRLDERLGALRSIDATLVQPTHGDLHVGQVLAGPHGLAIIDLDGNPTADAAVVQAPAPVARDVAAMLCSLDHVARIAIGRGARAHRVEAWLAVAETDFLDAYRAGLTAADRAALFDPRLVAPFRVEQECRELLYAARFLPRWRYAPVGALRALLEGR